MRIRGFGLLALAIAGGPACGKSRSDEPEIAWLAHVDEACRAAREQRKPVLFFYAASWDVATRKLEQHVFIDPEVRRIVGREYVPLRVDRTNTWMDDTAPADELREVEEAVRRFRPYASKHATVSVVGPDCATELHRFEPLFEPRPFAARLRSAAARAR